jgi:hypothetical protein
VRFIWTGLAVAVLLLAATQVATSSPAAQPVVVRATIWPNLIITFSPKKIERGTVTIRVKNRTTQTHLFTINGVTSRAISPNGAVLVKVTFKRRAIYSATLSDCGYPTQCVEGNPGQGPIGSFKVT